MLRSIKGKIYALIIVVLVAAVATISVVAIIRVIDKTNTLANNTSYQVLSLIKAYTYAEAKTETKLRQKLITRYRKDIKVTVESAVSLLDAMQTVAPTAKRYDIKWQQNAALNLFQKLPIFHVPRFYIFRYTRGKLHIILPPNLLRDDKFLFSGEQNTNVQKIDNIINNSGHGFISLVHKLPSGEKEEITEYLMFYPKWKWLVVASFSHKILEQRGTMFFSQIKKNLQSIFVHSTLNDFIFVLHGKGKITIHSKILKMTINPVASDGKLLFPIIMARADDCPTVCSFQQKTKLLESEKEPHDWDFKVTKLAPFGWYLVHAIRIETLHAPAKHLFFDLLLINLIVLICALIASIILAKKLTRPLQRLTQYTNDLPLQNFMLTPTAESEVKNLAIGSDDIAKLASAFLGLNAKLQQYIQNLKTSTAAKEHILSELKIAKQIQKGLLPEENHILPNGSNLELHALLRPAEQVAGDFYDFDYLDDNLLYFVVGDVSDKGPAASIFMALTRTLIKSGIKLIRNPGKLLSRVNNELLEQNRYNMFVTVFLGILHTKTGKLTYANAGHNMPLVVPVKEPARFFDDKPEPILGIFPDIIYHNKKMQLRSGELLFVYTDGATEAENQAKQAFGEIKLLDFASRYSKLPSLLQFNYHLLETLLDYMGSHYVNDDITMLALRLVTKRQRHTRSSTTHPLMTFDDTIKWVKLPGKLNSVAQAHQFINKELVPLHRFDSLLPDILCATEEAVVNIVKHGYGKVKKQMEYKLGLRIKEYSVTIYTVDYAQPFNPLESITAKLAKSFDEYQERGFGCLLMKELPDQLDYVYRNDQNIIAMTFYLPTL